jgi:glycosyltransferase involved in cell wall biosynthesis
MSERSIAVVTCYRQPDYVRAIALRNAAARHFDEVIVVKNKSTGVSRYLEVTRQLLALRGRKRPDAYLVTFRGYEILPVVLALAHKRPVYYDEFINPVEWFVFEHHKFPAGSLRAKVLRSIFRSLMKRTAGVLTDTVSHADYSAQLMGLDRSMFHPVPVGSDDETFVPPTEHAERAGLRILYYGSMLPLHGLDVVLEAALLLADRPDISLVLVGGTDATRAQISDAKSRGARIEYESWVAYDKLPDLIASCDLMLGGPFGATVQSQFVITGKTYQFLAMGVPTVIGVNRESSVFANRVDSLLVERGSASALAEVFAWAADNKEKLAQIGASGRALYEREFSGDVVADRLGVAFHEPTAQVQQAREDQ